jgi:uncharacterized protein
MDAAIIARIAQDTHIPESSVTAAVALFEKGATGPFTVHYRKEATGGLDEVKVRSIQERMAHYREVWDQRAGLLRLMSEQGKLTDELRAKIENCYTKVELDDLHHQFRPRKRTRATEAIEKGLGPLAEYFWNQETDAWSVEEHIDVFVDPAKEISTREQALQGVVDIIAEWIWENVECRKALRELLWNEGFVVSTVVPAKVGQKTKYNMYYERRESVTKIPSHRVLAIRRGCKEGILVSSIEGDNAKALERLLGPIIKEKESIFAPVLEAAARESNNRILRPLMETEVRTQLKERADREAIRVFQENLANLLLSPPAGPIVVMGIDWGKGDECSVAVVNEAGMFLEGAKIKLTAAPAVPPKKAFKDSGTPSAGPGPRTQEGVPNPQEMETRQDAEPAEPAPATRAESEVPTPPLSPETPHADPFSAASDVPSETADSISGEQPFAAEAPVAVAVELPLESESSTPVPLLETAPVESLPATPAVPSGAADSISGEQLPAMEASAAATAEPPVEPESSTPAPLLETAPAEFLPTVPSGAADSVPGEQSFAAETPDEVTTGPAPMQESAVLTEASSVEPLIAVSTAQPASESVENESSPKDRIQESRSILRDLITKYHVRAISIGTGTGARELESALRQTVSEEGLNDILIAGVNDAGIAVYSSSRIAREEFPDWSASARCAVSLARRLQDPLAELVKIDPKLIGVGQYQHDVDQKELHRGLLQTVQYCVNKVGVNINTAGESLLRYVSGLNDKLARRIVATRKSHGPFRSRASLISAAGLDESAYEQAAAFLRIQEGENPLDRTAIHPESYSIVEKIAASLGVGVNDLIGNRELTASLRLEDFFTETSGMPTLQNIREELMRPGRDPRKTFKVPRFRADVKEMSDLKPGMALEGTVTNVTNFGAFVDIGVRQDGLVHLSQMSNRFIRDPREAVKVGDVVQVKVISVEPETKRIGLSMKALLPPAQRHRKKQQRRRPISPAPDSRSGTALAETGAGADNASYSTAAGKADPTNQRPRLGRFHEGARGSRKRGPHRPPLTEEAQQNKQSTPKLPEPSLQEKIAILQSKFRGIN